MASLPIILTIIFGSFTVAGAIIGCTWKIGEKFAKIEAEMVGFREVLLAMNRRIERLESKLP